MKYNKLVRDNIPEIISARGEECTFHIASTSEYEQKLIEKFAEEVKEFQEDQSIDEMADIFEVIDAICKLKGIKKEEILKIQEEKRLKRGGFEKMIILDES